VRELDKHLEAPQQQRLHAVLGGTMLREFPVVPDTYAGRRQRRWIDSVVIPDLREVEFAGRSTDYVLCTVDYPFAWRDRQRLWEAIREHPVICVQAKRHRLGPRLLGQALFSRGLLEQEGVRVARTIASCGATEPELEAIAREEFGIDVIPDPAVGSTPEPMSLLRPHPDRDEFLEGIEERGAAVYRSFPNSRAATLRVEALVVHERSPRAPTAWSDLAGLEVTVVVTTDQRLCMYSLGIAVFMRKLAERHGASASAVLMVKAGDYSLEPLMRLHPGMKLYVKPITP
jgi:hypothetical protein